MGVLMDTKKTARVSRTKEDTMITYETWTYETSGNVEHIVFLKVDTLDNNLVTFHIECKNARHANAVFNQLSKAHIFG